LNNWELAPLRTTKSARDARTRTRKFGVLGFVLPILMVTAMLVSLAGCAGNDSSSPTAKEQLCTNLSSLKTSVNDLLDVSGSKSLSDFQAKWNTVKQDLNAVKTSAQSVADANTDPISTSFDALAQAVQNVPNAASISDAVASVKTAANNFLKALNDTVSNLKCSS
jgi:ElaB/YqjD/DUF883 family membrane-anchored ribosome-binding protein